MFSVSRQSLSGQIWSGEIFSNQQPTYKIQYEIQSLQKMPVGQVYKVVINHQYPMDMYTQGSFDLIVYTDALDRLNTGQTYSREIGRISSNDFFKKEGSPIMEIICINSDNYDFTYDII